MGINRVEKEGREKSKETEETLGKKMRLGGAKKGEKNIYLLS